MAKNQIGRQPKLKSFWTGWPLGVKFTLVITFLVTSAVISVSALAYYRDQVAFYAELEDQAKMILEGASATASVALMEEDQQSLAEVTRRIEAIPEVRHLRFFNRQGKPIEAPGSGPSPELDEIDSIGPKILENEQHLIVWGQDKLIAGQPVKNDKQVLGALAIEIGKAPLFAKVDDSRFQGLLVALTTVLIGIFMALILSRSVTEPLNELVTATRRLARGDLDQEIAIRSGDELAELGGAFNDMIAELRETLARKSAILEVALDAIFRIDGNGQILEYNPAAETMFGYGRDELGGENILALIHFPSSTPTPETSFFLRLEPGPDSILGKRIEGTGRRKNNSEFPIELAITAIPSTGESQYNTVIRDITAEQAAEKSLLRAQAELEKRVQERTAELAEANQALQGQMNELARTEAALRESEERFALAVQGANDGIWDWDIRSDEIYYSPRWLSILGYSEEDLHHQKDDWFSRIHPEDVETVKTALSNHLKGLSPHFKSEHRMAHKDGSYRWVLIRGLAIRDEQGTAYRMAGSLTDITKRKTAEEQLLHDAFHDALTGLPNRALFNDRLDRAIERTKRRDEYQFSVLFLDLDRFKVINDSLGHSVGDALLVGIARRLEVVLRSVDTVARLGGDEFVILLEDIVQLQDAERIAERIQEELKLPFFFENKKVYTTVSIGIVQSATGYIRPEDALRDADIAMYRAKTRGRARYEIFDTTMRAKAIARLELETDLRRAIGYQEFEIHYQPILSFSSNRIIGFEALVRWNHPQRGLISPEEFIPVAEETGLVIPIDWWVLRQACQQLVEWQQLYPADPPLTISVNVSSKHFTQSDLVQQIDNILDITKLDPRCLKLEITESVFMDNTADEVPGFAELRNLGIQLQIDDFGTGYSSLGYLQRFPIDTIKIDRSFVSNMVNDSTNAEIVRTILMLARELEMNAIAEGVETEEQLEQLKRLTCEFGQGFFISKPMTSQKAGELIAESLAAEPIQG